MKSMLHLKFIALYIIFGFLCLFTTATLTTQLVEDRLMEDTSQTLYSSIDCQRLSSFLFYRRFFH